MFGEALGSAIAIGVFVLVIALIYAALHIHHRSKTLNRERETRAPHMEAPAQRDNLKYQGGVGTVSARPHSSTPNDIT